MYHFLAVSLVAICLGAAQAASFTSGGPVSKKCPVQYKGECFRMFSSPSAFTRRAGEKFCHDLKITDDGLDGHLADIENKQIFEDIIAYLLTQKKEIDPNVLLGMRYEDGTMYRDNGDVLAAPYWGAGRPLSWGDNMVIRASERAASNKMQNMGGPETRYRRILCQFRMK